MDALAEARAEFDLAPGVYLDSATFGLPPRATAQAMHQAIEDWQSGRADWIRDWDRAGESCRADFASLIGAAADTIALIPAVSVGVGTIAASLGPQDEILLPDDEYTSVLYPVQIAQQTRGSKIRLAPLADLAKHVRPSTTLVAFSLIQSQSGRAAPLRDILRAAKAVGARTLIDATHAVPFVPLADDLPSIDYLACAAYKHLLCPRGVGFLYVAPEHWDEVPPILANWRSSPDPYHTYYGGDLSIAPNAARYDISLAWFSWAGGSHSLRLVADLHRRGVLPEVVSLAGRLADNLGLSRPSSSVLSVPVDDADAVREQLATAGVKCAVRAGSVRLSPHVYNTTSEIDRAAEALAPFVHVGK